MPVLPLARHRSISFPVNFQCLTFTARRRPDANTWQTPGSSLFQVGVLAWRCGPEVVAAAVSSMAPFTHPTTWNCTGIHCAQRMALVFLSSSRYCGYPVMIDGCSTDRRADCN